MADSYFAASLGLAQKYRQSTTVALCEDQLQNNRSVLVTWPELSTSDCSVQVASCHSPWARGTSCRKSSATLRIRHDLGTAVGREILDHAHLGIIRYAYFEESSTQD